MLPVPQCEHVLPTDAQLANKKNQTWTLPTAVVDSADTHLMPTWRRPTIGVIFLREAQFDAPVAELQFFHSLDFDLTGKP